MDSGPDSLTSEAMLFLLLHSGFEQPSVKKWAAVIYTPNYTTPQQPLYLSPSPLLGRLSVQLRL